MKRLIAALEWLAAMTHAIRITASLIPYLLVAWAGSAYTGRSFWFVLGLLVAARALFGVLDSLSATIMWRLSGKKELVRRYTEALSNGEFPPREYSHDDIGNYLARIQSLGDYPPGLRERAARFYAELATADEMLRSQGRWLQGARIWDAADAALEEFSPKASAPEWQPFAGSDGLTTAANFGEQFPSFAGQTAVQLAANRRRGESGAVGRFDPLPRADGKGGVLGVASRPGER